VRLGESSQCPSTQVPGGDDFDCLQRSVDVQEDGYFSHQPEEGVSVLEVNCIQDAQLASLKIHRLRLPTKSEGPIGPKQKCLS
jgi:hypothetical protein